MSSKAEVVSPGEMARSVRTASLNVNEFGDGGGAGRLLRLLAGEVADLEELEAKRAPAKVCSTGCPRAMKAQGGATSSQTTLLVEAAAMMCARECIDVDDMR